MDLFDNKIKSIGCEAFGRMFATERCLLQTLDLGQNDLLVPHTSAPLFLLLRLSTAFPIITGVVSDH